MFMKNPDGKNLVNAVFYLITLVQEITHISN